VVTQSPPEGRRAVEARGWGAVSEDEAVLLSEPDRSPSGVYSLNELPFAGHV